MTSINPTGGSLSIPKEGLNSERGQVGHQDPVKQLETMRPGGAQNLVDEIFSQKSGAPDNVQWKSLRFHPHEVKGKLIIDIVDKETGKVLKTIPQPNFQEQMKRSTGVIVNIHG